MQPKKIKTEPKGPERYTTIEQISEGAFGQVYKALDNQKSKRLTYVRSSCGHKAGL